MSPERPSGPHEIPVQVEYQDKSAVARFSNQRFFEAILSLTRDLAFKSVRDAGCGKGILLPAGQRSAKKSAGRTARNQRVRKYAATQVSKFKPTKNPIMA